MQEKTQNCATRHLKRLVKGDRRLSVAKIASDLNSSLPKPVMTRTLRSYVRDLGFEYRVKIEKAMAQ